MTNSMSEAELEEPLQAEMLAALEAQHRAIDALMAMAAHLSMDTPRPFFPSKSGWIWEAMLQGNRAIDKAKSAPKGAPP